MVIPGIPLVTILVATQVLNAVLLIPLLCVMIAIGRDENLMGELRLRRGSVIAYSVVTAVVISCVVALGVVAVLG